MAGATVKYAILGAVSFSVGFLSGFFFRTYFWDKSSRIAERKEGEFVLVVVTVVWAASVFVDILNPSYTTSPLIHGLMGAIVGFFYRPRRQNGHQGESK